MRFVSIWSRPKVDDAANVTSSASGRAEMKLLRVKMRKRASVKPTAALHTCLCPPSSNRKSRSSSFHIQSLWAMKHVLMLNTFYTINLLLFVITCVCLLLYYTATVELFCSVWPWVNDNNGMRLWDGWFYSLSLFLGSTKQISRPFLSSFKGFFWAAWIIDQWAITTQNLII